MTSILTMTIQTVLLVVVLNLGIFALTIFAILASILVRKFMVLICSTVAKVMYESPINGPHTTTREYS